MIRITWQRALGGCLLAVAASATQAATSGLIPSAGPVGATLYTDATVLWPLKAGVSTQFYGRTITSSAPAVYSNTLTLQASGSGFVEQHSNLLDAGSETSGLIQVVGGTISEQDQVQWVEGGVTSAYTLYHLKSPVRAGDRYVALDTRITDVGVDLDGDGKRDGLDVAAWTQVRNVELVDLPLRSGVRALRVDVFGKARARYTTGGVSAAVTLVQSRWYAPGLGLIKMQLDAPDDAGTGRTITQELAGNLDQLDAGLGHTALTTLRVPTGQTGAGTLLRTSLYKGIAANSEFAVLATGSTTTRLSKIDRRGQVVASQVYDLKPATGRGAWPADAQRLVMTPYGLRIVYRNASNGQLYLLKFSTDGQTQQATTATLLGPSDYAFAALYYNSRVWVVSTQSGQLTLQAYTAAGAPSGAPSVLSDQLDRADDLQVEAGAGKLVITWRDLFLGVDDATYTRRGVATFSATDGTLLGRDLLTPVSTYAPCNFDDFQLKPLVHGSAVSVLCYRGGDLGLGVRQSALTADFLVPRTGSGRVATSLFLPSPNNGERLWRSGSTLFHADFASIKLSPLHSYTSEAMVYRSQALTDSPPANSSFKVIARFVQSGANAKPMATVPFNDRLLVIMQSHRQTDGIESMIVWR